MTERKDQRGKKEIVFRPRTRKDSELNAEEYDTVVLRNLVPSTEIIDIKHGLEEVGYKVLSIRSAYSQVTGLALPLFFIKLYKNPINATIFQLKYVAHQVVIVEEYLQGPDLPRCTRCQDLDHIKYGCTKPPVCAWCSGSHFTTICDDVKTTLPTCSRCGGCHPSSYKGCKVYRQMCMIKALEDSNKKAITSGQSSSETSTSVTKALEVKKPMTSVSRMITSGNSPTYCKNSIISTNSSIIAVYKSVDTSGDNSIISPSTSIFNSDYSITDTNSLSSGNNSIIPAVNSITSSNNSIISAETLNISPYSLFPPEDFICSSNKFIISAESTESLIISANNSMVSTKHSNNSAMDSVTAASNSMISAKNYKTPFYSMFSANTSITSTKHSIIYADDSITSSNNSFFSDYNKNTSSFSMFSDSKWNTSSTSRTTVSNPLFSDNEWNISSSSNTSLKQTNNSSNDSFFSDSIWRTSSYTKFSDNKWNKPSSSRTSVSHPLFSDNKWNISSSSSSSPEETNTSSNNSFFSDNNWNSSSFSMFSDSNWNTSSTSSPSVNNSFFSDNNWIMSNNNSQISDDNWNSSAFSFFTTNPSTSATNPTPSPTYWGASASISTTSTQNSDKSRFSFVENAESERMSRPPGLPPLLMPELDPNAFREQLRIVADVIDHFSSMNEDLYQKLRELD